MKLSNRVLLSNAMCTVELFSVPLRMLVILDVDDTLMMLVDDYVHNHNVHRNVCWILKYELRKLTVGFEVLSLSLGQLIIQLSCSKYKISYSPFLCYFV